MSTQLDTTNEHETKNIIGEGLNQDIEDIIEQMAINIYQILIDGGHFCAVTQLSHVETPNQAEVIINGLNLKGSDKDKIMKDIRFLHQQSSSKQNLTTN